MNPLRHSTPGTRALTTRWMRQTVAVALVYIATARLSLTPCFPGTNASPVFPPAGLALAALLIMGIRV